MTEEVSKNPSRVVTRLRRLSQDKRMTAIVFICELGSVIALLLLADSGVANILHRQTFLATHISLEVLVGVLLGFQYLALISEFVVSYKVENYRRFTLPIAVLPFGNLIRFLILLILELLVLVPKLTFYFLSVLFSFLTMVLRVDRWFSLGVMDVVDRCTESYEIFVNRVYNLLHFNKIHSNSSVFSSVFNSSLTLWCINH